MRIEGRGVLITGGSRGLGAALGLRFAKAGARVALTARTPESLDRMVSEIRRKGGEAHGIVADVSIKGAVHATAAAASALVGDIDVLVNNASMLGPLPMPLLLDTACEDLEEVLATNLVGPFRLTKALLGSMALRQTGAVVFVTSDASVNAYANWGAYSVSKAAIDHLARTWGTEVEAFGVRMFAVDPGEMDTEMHAAAMPDADRRLLASPHDVAARIFDMVIGSEAIPLGARLVAADFSASGVAGVT